jgi:hypothetical protein
MSAEGFTTFGCSSEKFLLVLIKPLILKNRPVTLLKILFCFSYEYENFHKTVVIKMFRKPAMAGNLGTQIDL